MDFKLECLVDEHDFMTDEYYGSIPDQLREIFASEIKKEFRKQVREAISKSKFEETAKIMAKEAITKYAKLLEGKITFGIDYGKE